MRRKKRRRRKKIREEATCILSEKAYKGLLSQGNPFKPKVSLICLVVFARKPCENIGITTMCGGFRKETPWTHRYYCLFCFLEMGALLLLFNAPQGQCVTRSEKPYRGDFRRATLWKQRYYLYVWWFSQGNPVNNKTGITDMFGGVRKETLWKHRYY